MTEPSKESVRLLARSESMRQAISESCITKHWDKIDLDHMAEAGLMLWDQANDLSVKEPLVKPMLSEAISLIFEPLLFWSGQFDLSAILAQRRSNSHGSITSAKRPRWDSLVSHFLSLCYMGRFQDGLPFQRQLTFDRAHQAYGALSVHLPLLDPKTLAQVAYGWYLIGLPGVAQQLLHLSLDLESSKKYFLESNAPLFWQQAYISSAWIDSLRDT